MWSYSSSLEGFPFIIWVVAKPAPIATPTPTPNTILFRDTPIVIPIASPAPHPIILCVNLFIVLTYINNLKICAHLLLHTHYIIFHLVAENVVGFYLNVKILYLNQ